MMVDKKIEPFEIEEKRDERSFFNKYKYYILLLTVIVLILIALIVVVVVPINQKSTVSPVSSTTSKSSTKTTTIPGSTYTTTASTSTTPASTNSIPVSTNPISSTSSTTTTPASTISTTTVPIYDARIDCLPWLRGSNKIEAECKKIPLCIYQPISDLNSPACVYKLITNSLNIISTIPTDLGESVVIQKASSKSNNNIRIDFEYLDNHALRFKITEENENAYEVPIKVNKPNTKAKNPMYEVKINNDNGFSFQIIRKSTKTVLWDTSIGPIIYEKLNRQISTKLPSENVYGMGENKHQSFKHNLNYQNWPVFGRDQGVDDDYSGYVNLYGSQPFYTVMENDGNSHGVVLLNSNAFDYELIPNPGIVYRVTGGVLDFYMFLGPEPENVVQQYTEYFGRPFMIPYWALGFQISRYGYPNLDDMKKVLERFQEHNIPLDTQVADIDHYDKRKDFTIDPINWKELPEYFDYLHTVGMKTVMILDPALVVDEVEEYWPFETGLQNDVFIKWPNDVISPDYNYTNSSLMIGYCWPDGRVAYPDFFKTKTQKWWIESIERHYKQLKFDGIWIDMNEPATFGTNEEKPFNWPNNTEPWSLKCPDNEYENVKIKASYLYDTDKKITKLSDKSICMIGRQGENDEYKHFDVHNMYGYTESIPSFEASRLTTGTRGFVITRSTFIGSGKYGGHWTGDNRSRWTNLKYSIISMLEFNLFGIPYVGADICGFFDDTTKELCARWSSLGAFYPFSRNHNSIGTIPQDPGILGEPVISAAKNALDIRYELLPYYYTLFYKAHFFGNTVARPLFHEFPRDNSTYSIDEQFLIGPAFMVSPVIRQGETEVNAYFPADIWYNYHTGEIEHDSDSIGRTKTLNAELNEIPLHVRSGYIIPTQNPANTTEYSRQNPFGLIVALNSDNEAIGDLFYDDGKSQDILKNYFLSTFSVRDNKLQMDIEHNDYDESNLMILDKIRILTNNKLDSTLTFILNGTTISSSNVEFKNSEVILKNLQIPMFSTFKLEWTLSTNNDLIIDCSIQNKSITKEDCEAKGCDFKKSQDDTPSCSIPKLSGGFNLLANETSNGTYYLAKSDDFSLFTENDINDLVVKVSHGNLGNGFKASRLHITDRYQKRYEVPININFEETDDSYLDIKVDNNAENKAFLEVKNQLGDALFDTKDAEHGLIFNDQFIQIVINLGYKNVYGFGENTHTSYKHKFTHLNWWALFGRDQPTGGKSNNLYGVHPFFMAVNEENGRAFGVLILNSNGQEYGFIPPFSLNYRTVGGLLDIYVMEEESPEKVIQAYNLLIGTPYFPPYWSLGFQLSKYGYNKLENMKAALDRTTNAGIPIDVQYADIDHYRDNLDFTYDTVNFNGLPEYIEDVQSRGMKYIIILDPAINSEEPNYLPFIEGKEKEIFIKWPVDQNPQLNETSDGNNTILLGYVWPLGKTAFPDFFKTETQTWWSEQIEKHYQTLKFDGLWIDMNEPANFDTNFEKPWNWPKNKTAWNLICPNNKYDDPPYLPLLATIHGADKRISDKTICMRSLQGQNDEYIHYDVHNLFGWSQTQPTLNSLRKILDKRSIVITRSTYPSSGHHSGHWLGDNNSLWNHLKYNIIGMLEFNLFGIPYIGADICGFFSDATAEMCTRWMQLGAFNTFFRNHNGFSGIDQDPAALGVEVAAASKEVVEVRYTLLPYLYSLFYQVSKNGGTVIRSLMHEFPTDLRAHDIDRQFMWGSELLISPVLEKNKRTVYAYFPNARWFDYYSGAEVKETGRMHELDAPLSHLPLHVKGGSIIVTQEPAMNTHESRKNPYGLIVTPDVKDTKVKTTLFIDDGDDIYFEDNSTMIEITFEITNSKQIIQTDVVKQDYKLLPTNRLTTIRVFGIDSLKSILVNTFAHTSYIHYSNTKELVIHGLKCPLEAKNIIEIETN